MNYELLYYEIKTIHKNKIKGNGMSEIKPILRNQAFWENLFFYQKR